MSIEKWCNLGWSTRINQNQPTYSPQPINLWVKISSPEIRACLLTCSPPDKNKLQRFVRGSSRYGPKPWYLGGIWRTSKWCLVDDPRPATHRQKIILRSYTHTHTVRYTRKTWPNFRVFGFGSVPSHTQFMPICWFLAGQLAMAAMGQNPAILVNPKIASKYE